MPEMPCMRCGKLFRGSYHSRCICPKDQKEIYYQAVKDSMRIVSGSKCRVPAHDIMREAIKRGLILKRRIKLAESRFPPKPIDSGLLAIKIQNKEGGVFWKKKKKRRYRVTTAKDSR